MDQLSRLATVEENYPLSQATTFKIGGPARYFLAVADPENLPEIFTILKANNLPYFILGRGANVLASDRGFAGAVLHLISQNWQISAETDLEVFLRVDAGLRWDDLVKICVDHQWWGIENMSFVPGTVGGIVAVSAACYGQQASDLVVRVRAWDIVEEKFVELTPAECNFQYRSSIFNQAEVSRYVITAVDFRLKKEAKPEINYPDVVEYFKNKKIDEPTIGQVREALYFIRSNKLPDYHQIGSAGSYFKNVYFTAAELPALLARVEENFGADWRAETEKICNKFSSNGIGKIPSGFILDKLLNLGGKQMGGARVYEKQTLIIINATGAATAADVIMLVSYIKQQVRDKLGIQLEEEVRYLGF